MKVIKTALCLVIFVSILFLFQKVTSDFSFFPKVFVGVVVLLFLFNLAVRRTLLFEPYFKSSFNIFTCKHCQEQIVDVSTGLMFEKLEEVLRDSEFKLVDLNSETMELLVVSKFSMSSWGENIYVSLKEDNDKTIVSFCSVTLFQVCSWGKNENNIAKLMARLEKSFII